MVEVVPTNVRSPRTSAILMALQSAEGTLATDFSSGARLWENETSLPVSQPIQEEPRGAETQDLSDDVSMRHDAPDGEAGRIVCKATPESVEFILRSIWGQFSGGAFTLNTQPKEFFSLALVESSVLSEAQKLVRWRDVMFRRVVFKAADFEEVIIDAEYIHSGRTVGVNGDVTLPTLNVDKPGPADTNIFSYRASEFFRGTSVELRQSRIEVTLDVSGVSDHSETGGVRTRKLGPAQAIIEVVAQVSDEAWTVLTNADAGTEEGFRFSSKSPSPVKTWRLDIKNTRFSFDPLSRVDLNVVDFVGRGKAMVGSGGSFVGFTLS